MAIYEYECQDCHEEFEQRKPMAEASAPVTCPHCGGTAERLASVFGSTDASKLRVPERGPLRKKAA